MYAHTTPVNDIHNANFSCNVDTFQPLTFLEGKIGTNPRPNGRYGEGLIAERVGQD